MSRIDYDGRRFRSISNAANGEVTPDTIFHYRQEGELVWATYRGGAIVWGMLIAKAGDDGCLDMRYQHLNAGGELMTGICRSTPEILADGRLRMHERWQWTSGDGSAGVSVIEETRDERWEFMATRLQPHLAELVEKKRRELNAAIQGVRKTLARLQHSLDSNSDLAHNEAEELHRECGVLNRLCAELQTLESVAKVDRESGKLDGRTRQGISNKTQRIT